VLDRCLPLEPHPSAQFVVLILAELGFELRVLCSLGTLLFEPRPQSILLWIFLEMEV
jgi:hypothetical protein